MSFQNCRRPNTSLCKCLTSHVLVHPGTVNMLKGPKHCSNMHDRSFITFAHHSGKISVEKGLS